jgi:regulator of sigma E protease
MIVTVVVFLAVLVVIILAHELGHFVTARARGVTVLEFGLGFPPRIFGIKRGETIYSINAIPLGGFCKMAGEEDPNVEGSLASKGPFSRLLVLGAGSLVNLLLPIVFFSLAAMIPHNLPVQPVLVKSVADNSPAYAAGFTAGDTIISVNGRQVDNVSDLQRYIHLNLGKDVVIEVKDSSGAIKNLNVIPRWNPPAGQGAIGIEIDVEYAQAHTTNIRTAEPFWRAIPSGFQECADAFVLFKNEIFNWIIGASKPQVVGPVGIAEITGQVVRSGFSPLLEWAAFISINLGIINILPLPALDGGRIAFVALEVIRRGRRIKPRTEGLIHLIGFALLIGLMLLVTYRDIINIIVSGSAIP